MRQAKKRSPELWTVERLEQPRKVGGQPVAWPIQIANRAFCYHLLSRSGRGTIRSLPVSIHGDSFPKDECGFTEYRPRSWDSALAGGRLADDEVAASEAAISGCTEILKTPLWDLLTWDPPSANTLRCAYEALPEAIREEIYWAEINEAALLEIGHAVTHDQIETAAKLGSLESMLSLAFLARVTERVHNEDRRRDALKALEMQYPKSASSPQIFPIWAELWACVLLMLQKRALGGTIGRRGFSIDLEQVVLGKVDPGCVANVSSWTFLDPKGRQPAFWSSWLARQFRELDQRAGISTILFDGNWPQNPLQS